MSRYVYYNSRTNSYIFAATGDKLIKAFFLNVVHGKRTYSLHKLQMEEEMFNQKYCMLSLFQI